MRLWCRYVPRYGLWIIIMLWIMDVIHTPMVKSHYCKLMEFGYVNVVNAKLNGCRHLWLMALDGRHWRRALRAISTIPCAEPFCGRRVKNRISPPPCRCIGFADPALDNFDKSIGSISVADPISRRLRCVLDQNLLLKLREPTEWRLWIGDEMVVWRLRESRSLSLSALCLVSKISFPFIRIRFRNCFRNPCPHCRSVAPLPLQFPCRVRMAERKDTEK